MSAPSSASPQAITASLLAVSQLQHRSAATSLAVRPQQPAATITARSRCPPTGMHPQRQPTSSVDADHLNIAQSHQQLTNTYRVNFHRDPPDSQQWSAPNRSCAFNRGPSPHRLHLQTRSAAFATAAMLWRNPALNCWSRHLSRESVQRVRPTFAWSYGKTAATVSYGCTSVEPSYRSSEVQATVSVAVCVGPNPSERRNGKFLMLRSICNAVRTHSI